MSLESAQHKFNGTAMPSVPGQENKPEALTQPVVATIANSNQSLHKLIIVQTLERVIERTSRDSGLYSDLIIARRHICSDPMKRELVTAYLDKREQNPDTVIAWWLYEVSEISLENLGVD